MVNNDRLSFTISSLLDSMGFSRDMVDFRVNTIMHENGISEGENICVIRTGGTADGTSLLGQGDIDVMRITKIAIVSGRHIDPKSLQHTVLYTEDTGVHHGYTWLRVGHQGLMSDVIFQSLVNANTALYVSSSLFNQIIMQELLQRFSSLMQIQPMSGPSTPVIHSGGESIDNVNAFFHQEWPSQASQWIDRCRINGWPPESIVTAIVRSGCHIVPKGFKGSPSEHMEWSISFAVHETSIINLFNLTQKHVYILLKMMAKDLRESFTDLQDLLTSYTMKTVALWQVELHHTRDWDRYHLLDRLIEALAFLKSCVENQNLPAYFITENNLFDGKMNVFQAAVLSHHLDNLLSQGVECVLRFSSIQQQLQNSQVQCLRQSLGIHWGGLEMGILISQSCCRFLTVDMSMMHTRHVLSQINSPNVSRNVLFIKMMKATFAYLTIAKIKNMGMSNRIKYKLYRYLLHFASANIDTDRMSGRVKFASVLHVLGNTNKAFETLCDIKQQPTFERLQSTRVAFVDPDMLRNYLLYKCHSEFGNESNAQAAFINLIRIATQEWFDPHIEHREVALNVLGLCYLEKKDYLRGYICLCRAMSLRPRLLKEEWSTSTPWHLAVLLSKLINSEKQSQSITKENHYSTNWCRRYVFVYQWQLKNSNFVASV